MILENRIDYTSKIRLKRRNKYFQSVFSWLSTSFLCFVINMATNHQANWWKAVFFFWGIAILFKTMNFIKHEIWNEDYLEDNNKQKQRKKQVLFENNEDTPLDLNQPKKEPETVKKYWNDKDFV